ncbi:MAG: TetR/AcrR family transcriptional regulator [Myxococcota bacterium]
MQLSPSQRRRQANRERILDAAAQLVAIDGLEALSIARVANLADYTPGALYRYFPSKEALLSALAIEATARVGAALAGCEGPPLTRAVSCAQRYVRFASDEPHVFALLSTLTAEPRTLVDSAPHSDDVALALTNVLAPVAAMLEAAANDGKLAQGDAMERALMLWAALHGALQLRKQASRLPALAESDLTSALIRTLFVGFGANASAVSRALRTAP